MKPNRHLDLILISVTMVGISLSCWSGWLFYKVEEKSIVTDFQRDVDERAASIYREIMINFETLRSLAILFNGEDIPDHARFHNEAQKILNRHTDILALEWVPRIAQEQGSQYESTIRKYCPNNEFREQLTQRKQVTSESQQECFPVYFAETLVENESLLGFDISSCPICLEALINSRDSALPQITTSIMFEPENEKENGFIAFLPIYRGEPLTVDKRREDLLGFVLGVHRYHNILTSSVLSRKGLGIEMKLIDITLGFDAHVLHTHKSRTGSPVYEAIVYYKDMPEVWGVVVN